MSVNFELILNQFLHRTVISHLCEGVCAVQGGILEVCTLMCFSHPLQGLKIRNGEKPLFSSLQTIVSCYCTEGFLEQESTRLVF